MKNIVFSDAVRFIDFKSSIEPSAGFQIIQEKEDLTNTIIIAVYDPCGKKVFTFNSYQLMYVDTYWARNTKLLPEAVVLLLEHYMAEAQKLYEESLS